MVELVIRVVVSLALVLGLLWLIARASSRRFGGAARSSVRVVARQSLARNSSLAVVEVGERVLVVGVGEHGVSLLTELDPGEMPDVETAPAVRPGRVGGFPLLGGVPEPERIVTAHPDGPGAHAARPAGLYGSMLSAGTWKQAWAAATSRSGGSGG